MILGTFLFFMVEGFLDNCCLNKIQYENFGALGNFSICNWLCSNSFFVLGFLVLLIALLSGIVDGKNEQTKWILIAISVILLSFISFFSAIKHIDGYCLSKLNRYDTFNSTRNLKSERCHESGSCLFVFGVPLTVPLALLIYTILEVDDELTRPFTIRSSIVLIVLVIMCIIVEYMEACINTCYWILYKRTGQQKPVNISRMCKNFLLAGTFFIFCLAIVLLEKQYLIFGRFRIDWFLIILLIEISIYLVIFIKSISTECVPWITRKRKSTKTNVFIYTLEEILKDLFANVPDDSKLSELEETSKSILDQIGLNQNEGYELYLSGSTAERFCTPVTSKYKINNFSHALLSDCDFMISPICQNVSFKEDDQKYYVTEFYCVISDGVSPVNGETIKKQLLAAINFNLEHSPNFVGRIRGPAVNLVIKDDSTWFSLFDIDRFYGDLVFALKFPEWPENLCNWSIRPNKQWPIPMEIERIKSYGCHLVAKSHPYDETFTWRISLSKAEVELSKLVPENARMCFIGIKIIVKDYLSTICKKLSSYHLKCIFFYTLERHNPTLWDEESIENSFSLILSNFINCIETKNCPHFWFPIINMFEDFNERDFKNLASKLEEISENPSKFMEPFRNVERIC